MLLFSLTPNTAYNTQFTHELSATWVGKCVFISNTLSAITFWVYLCILPTQGYCGHATYIANMKGTTILKPHAHRQPKPQAIRVELFVRYYLEIPSCRPLLLLWGEREATWKPYLVCHLPVCFCSLSVKVRMKRYSDETNPTGLRGNSPAALNQRNMVGMTSQSLYSRGTVGISSSLGLRFRRWLFFVTIYIELPQKCIPQEIKKICVLILCLSWCAICTIHCQTFM